jgi:hypothetical protein
LAALTQSYEAFEKPGLVVSYKASNVDLFKGALIGVNASGHCVPMAHGTANLKFLGVANENCANATGSAGGKSFTVTKSGSFVYKAASGYTPAAGDIGKEVYSNTDNEVQISSAGLTNAYKVGTIIGLETPASGGLGVRIRIDNYTV